MGQGESWGAKDCLKVAEYLFHPRGVVHPLEDWKITAADVSIIITVFRLHSGRRKSCTKVLKFLNVELIKYIKRTVHGI